MGNTTNRREFLGSSILAGLAMGAGSSAQADAPSSSPAGTPAELPSGQLGKLKISRLIAGGNLLSGWCHQRDLLFIRQLAEAYLTENRQFDSLQLMEQFGINTIMIDMMQLPIISKYKRERGGKMQTIASVRQDWGAWNRPDIGEMRTAIARAIDQGADLLFVHGGYSDRLVQSGKPERIELLAQTLACMREHGLPAAVGSHALEVPVACEKNGIVVDFHVKSFHHDRYWSATPKDRRKRFCVDGPRSMDHDEYCDNIFCIDPEDTAAFFARQKTPWIAYKVLAAGSIDPKSGFSYAFENGADFISVGMFDFNVAQDVAVLKDVLANLKRQRPWAA